MLRTKNSYISILSSIFVILLIVLALFDRNKIDYFYLGFVLILILKNIVASFVK